MKFKPLVNLFAVSSLLIVLAFAITPFSSAKGTITVTPANTSPPKGTVLPSATFAPTFTPGATFTASPSAIPSATPTIAPSPTPGQSGNIQPYPNAPLCSGHDNTLFHTLWDSARGCHYSTEHGDNPFTPAVAAAFPGFDLRALLGGVEIGSTNPSSPVENVAKHGGEKWQVMTSPLHGCVGGFEDAVYCVTAAVIEIHGFGNYAIEMESRIHSAVALLKVCNPANPSDCGYLYTVQHEEFGQRIVPYQGTVMIYPNSPPPYASASGQYFSIDCVGAVIQCRSSRDYVLSRNANSNSIWTSKPTGLGANTRPPGSTIFQLLFRVRDVYQLFDFNDQTYPFTFLWVCSADGGATYNPAGCRYNNATTRVHEVAGVIPAAWDNLPNFDTNPAIGRITASGFTDKFGTLSPSCTIAGGACFPIKMVNMFVGKYGDFLQSTNTSNPTITSNPSRNIWFCNGVVCSETVPGAVPSGWIGSEN